MLPWYFILAISLGAVVFVLIVGVIVIHCIRLNRNNYHKVNQDVEPGCEENEETEKEVAVEVDDKDDTTAIPLSESGLTHLPSKRVRIASESSKANRIITIEEVDEAISSSTESSAEKCMSDRSDHEDDDTISIGSLRHSRGSVGSAGSFNQRHKSIPVDSRSSMSGSMISLTSNASWTSSKSVSNLNLNVQCSLIYSRDMRHIAGKIIQCDGLTFFGNKKPTHVRVHAVVLPIKKYALKTSWYQIPNDGDGSVRIGEYFKFVFKLPPSELKTMLRIRLYGRKAKVGSLGRPSCMGECYVTLLEIINSKGGLTLWRTLSRGIPEAILESQVD